MEDDEDDVSMILFRIAEFQKYICSKPVDIVNLTFRVQQYHRKEASMSNIGGNYLS